MKFEKYVDHKKSTLVSEEEDDDNKHDMEVQEHVEQKKSIIFSEEYNGDEKQDEKVGEHVEQKIYITRSSSYLIYFVSGKHRERDLEVLERSQLDLGVTRMNEKKGWTDGWKVLYGF